MAAESKRVALVTGAARGIGAATVDRLVGAGCHVIAVDICATQDLVGVDYPLATTADLDALLVRHGDRVLTRVVDVRDIDQLRATVDEGVATFGRLDVAVAAAAVILGGAPLWETPTDHLRTLLDVDVVGVWNTAAAAMPHMVNGDDPSGCRFVAVASAAGRHGLYNLAAYNAAKHAVIGIVRGLAADLVGTGVTAVAVSPGSTDTDMLNATAALYDVSAEALAQSQLLRRRLSADEVAATIAFCCSHDGAALNGSVVSATGGFHG